MTITSDDINNLINQGDGITVEIKKCTDNVPRSVWETYSAFANTRGGVILHARNRNIQKMFRMIGYGDNIGSGFQKILTAWNTLGYIRPELKELEDVKEVWLSLPLAQYNKSVDGTSNENSTVKSTVKYSDDIILGDDLTDIQALILQHMIEFPSITIVELSTVTGLDRNAVNYQLKKLRKIINIERLGSDKKGSWKISPK